MLAYAKNKHNKYQMHQANTNPDRVTIFFLMYHYVITVLFHHYFYHKPSWNYYIIINVIRSSFINLIKFYQDTVLIRTQDKDPTILKPTT